MLVRWSIEAADSFEAICDYVAQVNPAAASRIAITIYEAASGLAVFPLRGRPGRLMGTRELVLSPLPYLVIYRITGPGVEVVRVLHGAQQWP